MLQDGGGVALEEEEELSKSLSTEVLMLGGSPLLGGIVRSEETFMEGRS